MLERDGKDTLTVCESCGVLHGAISEERVDRGEAHIAGGDAVVPVELQVLNRQRALRRVVVSYGQPYQLPASQPVVASSTMRTL